VPHHRLLRAGLAVAALGALALPSSAAARDATVASFDGTTINVHFFPAAGLDVGAKTPTVLEGPGWGSAGETNEDAKTSASGGVVGVGPLRRAGFNVLTWDPRGFGGSGGVASVDGPDYEGRDVQALLDFVAQQPEALLDDVGDPRVGMAGGSYGGGIQLVTAGLDQRLDAIVPDIAWHSLTTSLYQDDTYKSGWSSLLYAAGKAGSGGRLDPHVDSSFASGSATGRISAEDAAWYASRGPGDALVSKIRTPTLLVQGTVDTLFPLDEAVANYTQLKKTSGAPVKMLWFCGGHGTCLTKPGDTSLIEKRELAWLTRYLFKDKKVDTGPGFEWVDQRGVEHTASAYPPRAGAPLTATAHGGLTLQAAGGSGPTPAPPGADPIGAAASITNGTKATNAINVTFKAPSRVTQVVGAPQVTLTYSGTATDPDARVFGQVVDDGSGYVLGNLVTPIPLVLDGRPHTVSRPLELVSASLRPSNTFTLQIVASTTAYAQSGSFNTGSVDFSAISASLPTVAAPKVRVKVVSFKRLSARRFRITVRSVNGALHDVRIAVRSKGGRTLGTRSLSRLGTKRRTVVVKLKARAGRHATVHVTAKR
jgi:ABC-2 type transport system ATP-binding protein